MAEPFKAPSPGKLGRIAGLAGRRKRAFLSDVEALLAASERVAAVDPSRIEKLAREHEIDLATEVSTPRRSLYRRFLEYCLNDHALSPDESEDLTHLRKLLSLEEGEVAAIHDDVGRAVYGDAIAVVLEDYKLDPEEEAFLSRLRHEIGLSDDAAAELEHAGSQRARARYVNRSAVHRNSVVARKGAELELAGKSEVGLQQAIEDAIGCACETLPELESAELKDLRVEIRAGAPVRWHVKLTTRLP
jgi:flavin-binding protein dodecin